MNDYELIRQIGEGAFGKAFLARDTGAGGDRQCVVKQIDLTKVRQPSVRFSNTSPVTATVRPAVGTSCFMGG